MTALCAGVALAVVLPAPVGRAVAETTGVLAARTAGVASLAGVGRVRGHRVGGNGLNGLRGLAERRDAVAGNLRRVGGDSVGGLELRRQVDEAFGSYARYWAESLRLPSLSRRELEAGMTAEGMEHLEAAREKGRGAIFALPHLGGWEWGGAWLASLGVPVSVVVEALGDREVFEWFVSFRRRLGMEVIATGADAGRRCLAALAANRVLCLLSDRVVGATPGVEVEFFGERTRLPAGAVTLSYRTGAPVLPAAVYFGRGSSEHRTVILPPLEAPRSQRFREDVVRGTQLLAHELERLIRAAPAQWHVMQPNWPAAGG
ncbi:MAG: phosphatidylinositol mannoside acyltransferase [Acidimicrobiales bacterium]